jgi:hypothetical protein
MAGGAFRTAIPWSISFAYCSAHSTTGKIMTMSRRDVVHAKIVLRLATAIDARRQHQSLPF